MNNLETLEAVQAIVRSAFKVREPDGWRCEHITQLYAPGQPNHEKRLFVSAAWSGPKMGSCVVVLAFCDLTVHIRRIGCGGAPGDALPKRCDEDQLTKTIEDALVVEDTQ